MNKNLNIILTNTQVCMRISHVSESIQYLSLSKGLILLSKMPSNFIHTVANVKIAFNFMAEIHISDFEHLFIYLLAI